MEMSLVKSSRYPRANPPPSSRWVARIVGSGPSGADVALDSVCRALSVRSGSRVVDMEEGMVWRRMGARP